MAVMAKWYTKTWVVSPSKVVALEELSFSYALADNENTSTSKKKTTSEKKEPVTLSFTTVLHSGAGVDVRAEIEHWERLVTLAAFFYLGGKQLGTKQFQLRKVSVNNVKLDDFGRIRVATLSFEFKEYDSGKADGTHTANTITAATKSQKKTTIKAVSKAKTQTIKVGSYVKPTGKKYATGETIPSWVKQRSHKVSQIKGEKILLGHPDGINSWVYKSEVTLV